MSNCSLGVAYGNQRRNGEDPIVDCFARVENVPRQVLRKVGDAVHWNDSAAYLEHFERLPLGPNVMPMIPHSMLRIEVMGLQASVTREPTSDELARMAALLEKGMEEGYAGFSTDALPFHYLANRPNTRKQIPTQFAPFYELKRLTNIVRRWDRVWQATPPKDSPLATLRTFLLSSGRLYGRRLKTTAVAAIDLHTNRSLAKLGMALSRLLNSKLVGGLFRFQALSAPFKLWSDGVITPIAEEIPELRVLNECELDDRAGRLRILNDPEYTRAFRAMWHKGKRGFNLANLKRRLGREDNVLNRRLDDMHVESCPLPCWNGETLETAVPPPADLAVRQRLARDPEPGRGRLLRHFPAAGWRRRRFLPAPAAAMGHAAALAYHHRQPRSGGGEEAAVRSAQPPRLQRLRRAPHQHGVLRRQPAHPENRPGRRPATGRRGGAAHDAGAGGILRPQRRHAEPRRPGRPVRGGPGGAAALKSAAGEPPIHYIRREIFDCEQLVNRPVGVVTQVMIAGKLAWNEGAYTHAYSRERFGRVLRAKDHPAEQALASTVPPLLAAQHSLNLAF